MTFLPSSLTILYSPLVQISGKLSMFNQYLKPFMINGSDLDFITAQVNLRPLFDATGEAIIAWDGIGAIYNGYGQQIWDGTGLTATAAVAA